MARAGKQWKESILKSHGRVKRWSRVCRAKGRKVCTFILQPSYYCVTMTSIWENIITVILD